jgi:tetratricopeptide (TPR) repeat protein
MGQLAQKRLGRGVMDDERAYLEQLRKNGLAKATRQFTAEHDCDGAARTLADLMAIFPKDPIIGTLLGNVFIAGGQEEKGRLELESVLRDHPKFPAAYYAMGVYYSEKQQWERAAESYKNAIKHYPPNASQMRADAWQNLGCALWENRDKLEALEAWRTCLKLDPGNERAKRNLEDCTSGYGLPKSISPAMDDSHAFTDMKMREYLSVKGKNEYSGLDEANAVLMKITDAWNRQIAAKYGRGLDDLSIKEKIRIFKATKVDFDIDPLDKGNARRKSGGKKGR